MEHAKLLRHLQLFQLEDCIDDVLGEGEKMNSFNRVKGDEIEVRGGDS